VALDGKRSKIAVYHTPSPARTVFCSAFTGIIKTNGNERAIAMPAI